MARNRISKDHVSQFFEHGLDIDGRLIDFSTTGNDEDDLGKDLAVRTIKALRLLDRTRTDEPITIMINCGGGDVDAGLAVYDAIRRCKSPVHCEVVGVAYSMAAWVLQAGDKRLIQRHSSLMIHDGEGDISGRPRDMMNAKKFDDEQGRLCNEILLTRIKEKHPNYTHSKLQKLLDTDTYLHPEQALALGLVDEIIE